MKKVTDIDVQIAIASTVSCTEIELTNIFNNGMDSEITNNFMFQLTTAIQSLLMGRPVIIPLDHPFGASTPLVEDAPLGKIHPDADLLESSSNPTEKPRRRRLLH